MVNWFRKDEDGSFLWPGYGENSRVLAWVFRRCDDEAEAVETPIGRLPTVDALPTEGLDVSRRGPRGAGALRPGGLGRPAAAGARALRASSATGCRNAPQPARPIGGPGRLMADVRAAPRYSIVPGDPQQHKDEVLALGYRNLPPAVQGAREARYAKYFEDSPLGPPHFFLARDAQSDSFVGMAAIFPTQLRVFGELVPAAVAGEFAVDDGHRGLGPAVPLQRAAVAALGEHGLACAFGYPNEHSEPITRRVGYVDLGRLTRFVKVLRSRILVEQYGRGRVAAAWRGSRSTRCCRCSRASGSTGAGATLRVERPAAFDDRFSEVWETTWRQGTITSERNPELLNWKYEMGRERRASTGPSRWSARTSRSPATPSTAIGTASATSSTSFRAVPGRPRRPARRADPRRAQAGRARDQPDPPRRAGPADPAPEGVRVRRAERRTAACTCTCRATPSSSRRSSRPELELPPADADV